MTSDKRVRILSAAGVLISRSGVDACSIHRVAKQAGVATGTIYLYFKNKETLMAELHERNLRLYAEAFVAGVEDESDLLGQHRRLWRNALNYHKLNPTIHRLWVHLETLPRGHRHQQLVEDLFQPVKHFLSSGVEQGYFKPLPGELLYALAFGQINEICRFMMLRQVQFSEQNMDAAQLASWDAIILHP
ncbi:TetR/AcrR family transcriptional regulator [Agarivorans sp. QJM3NY_29]|uniref:TetR/AcrR family transcriptional regulator n=1 Tax=unclassified Agarivorans TaxID=2636026 RepID=UPI003D7D71E6